MCGNRSIPKSVRLDLKPREREDLKLIMEEEGVTTGAQVVRMLIKRYAKKLKQKRGRRREVAS